MAAIAESLVDFIKRGTVLREETFFIFNAPLEGVGVGLPAAVDGSCSPKTVCRHGMATSINSRFKSNPGGMEKLRTGRKPCLLI